MVFILKFATIARKPEFFRLSFGYCVSRMTVTISPSFSFEYRFVCILTTLNQILINAPVEENYRYDHNCDSYDWYGNSRGNSFP